MLAAFVDVWKECFNYTWMPCVVRTNLICFKYVALGSLFCLFLQGGEEKIEKQQQAVVCIRFLAGWTSQRNGDHL